MKSLWKNLVQSVLVVGLTASLTGTLIAQDSGQAGIVRISRPKMSDVANGRVTPTSAMLMDGSCNATNGSTQSAGAGSPSYVAGPGQNYAGQDIQYSDYPSGNIGGSSFQSRARMHSAAAHQMYFGDGRHVGGVYYHDHSGQAMLEYFKCKFGYFIPTGGGGAGLPWVGHYSRVYPVTPYHNDPRDGQVWAAQGYGIPISVPLAPVVGHTYEYGWGVPSSRLVPVSNPAY